MVDVTLSGLSLTYPGATKPSLEDVSIHIEDGEFIVLVGPSGCGKSTTLRLLAGFELPTAGDIRFGDRDVTGVGAMDRDVSMVFQSYALYPHMTVAGNMEFALKNSGVPKAERTKRVRSAAELLELEDYLDRKPRELSGGQRQRVAMGRAIVRQPQVFLMDEPLSNLDAKLRTQTRTQIADLQQRLGVTTVYVTHDQTEAMTMGDRVVVMNAGRIEQVGTPRELYDEPDTLFVAGFIGSPTMNLVHVQPNDDGAAATNASLALTVNRFPGHEGEEVIGIRPEDLRLVHEGEPAPTVPSITMTVGFVEELGSDLFVYARSTDGTRKRPAVARLPKGHAPAVGDELTFAVEHERILHFDAATERRLR
ncbi:sn-glycerol-3-phosphate ABC transporter ATP-binding protein UgpC [Pseudoclavibacter chungangensis]|uniref:sn-glycerol-3-phosphate ABC transporter ATP-binding protein UgpC n=1 Tax=Pseudoclavibacter chungangensis TaxID=587635 RepID=A0A7J5BSY1_9MICO|nr:sn-glycerol-3-phosphate ABC transporter ATP-binding protein UgpC [Pseudoclavibacter chungangensis]KAB1656292.1 sn-glycerol-3-phosphate ABC transporter ATP-binding protein UgpC [Pseudoclavibacter chungangensis]NYJ67052.1 ABC-type sugar transport system ATPase subunit [Pseudoclavibacter chungangensis]